MKNNKKCYISPRMEISRLVNADIITASIEVPLTAHSVKQSQVDNSIGDSSTSVARWDADDSPIS